MRHQTSRAALAAAYLRKYKDNGQKKVDESDVKMKMFRWERLNRLLEAHQKGMGNREMAAAKC
jgi:hypothetical protein